MAEKEKEGSGENVLRRRDYEHTGPWLKEKNGADRETLGENSKEQVVKGGSPNHPVG